MAHKIAAILPNPLYRVYVTLFETKPGAFPLPDLIVHWPAAEGAASLVTRLLQHMGPEFLRRNQKAWEAIQSLYPDEWQILNQRYTESE